MSYTKVDRQWAEWVAWELEENSYTTVLQDWDFRPGQNFVVRMHLAARQADRTIALLSPEYLDADYTQAEWAAAFAQDPTGEKSLLVPIRIKACDLQGLLPQIIYIDLVGLKEAEASARLLAGVQKGRAKPKTKPDFPPVPRSIAQRPNFPGRTRFNKLLLLIPLLITAGILTFYLRNILIHPSSFFYSQPRGTESSQRPKIVLIFCDISKSLTEPEIKKGASLTSDILDSLPANARYAVYPIQRDTGHPPLIPSEIIPEVRTSLDRERYEGQKVTRRAKIENEVYLLYSDAKYQNSARHTCILNLLPFVQERFTRMVDSFLDSSKYDFEVYFISDMVENCDETPIGPIRMDDFDSLVLIQLLAKRYPDIPYAPNLSNVRVTIIIPSTPESNGPLSKKPSSEFLKGFWRAIFLHCGLKEEWFWDQKHIDWISNGELPDRLRLKS